MIRMSGEDDGVSDNSVGTNSSDESKNVLFTTTNDSKNATVLADNSTDLSEQERTYNGTGYYIENDDVDNSFNDVQTLFLACFATLVPLILSLITAFAIRIVWRKYKRNRKCSTYDGVLHPEESSDHLSTQSGAPLHTRLLNSEQTKSCESQFSIIPDEIEQHTDGSSPGISSSRTNHASTNGSVITMTLKNNHLIVETEERNDLTEDSKETTMKYSPSLHDGVFVVEVQQGVRTRDLVHQQEDPKLMNQQALVHNPPERFNDEETLEEIDEEFYMETTSPRNSTPNTGLSQSTFSISSGGDPNSSYRYGNQQGYDNGYYGSTNDNLIGNEPISKLPRNRKPKITSAIYKENGQLMWMASLEPDGGLLSDRFVKQYSFIETEPEPEPDDAIQEEQRRLGNTSCDEVDDDSNLNSNRNQNVDKFQNELSPPIISDNEYENKAYDE